jgi:uncharacterized protein YrrD
MQLRENADVLSWEGQKIGRVDRVVIDPESKEVTHLVIKKGLLLTQDKVIPVDEWVDKATEDQVILKKAAGNPEEWPDFEETHHVPVDDMKPYRRRQPGYARPVMWYYSRPGFPWWGTGPYPGYPSPRYVARTERNIPGDAVPLEEGAKVLSKDDENVGNVESVYVEPEGNRATHLLISRGLLSKERKLIPTNWVDRVFEDEVRLSVEKDVIDSVPVHSASG